MYSNGCVTRSDREEQIGVPSTHAGITDAWDLAPDLADAGLRCGTLRALRPMVRTDGIGTDPARFDLGVIQIVGRNSGEHDTRSPNRPRHPGIFVDGHRAEREIDIIRAREYPPRS